jgi:hypothetical protein
MTLQATLPAYRLCVRGDQGHLTHGPGYTNELVRGGKTAGWRLKRCSTRSTFQQRFSDLTIPIRSLGQPGHGHVELVTMSHIFRLWTRYRISILEVNLVLKHVQGPGRTAGKQTPKVGKDVT